MVPDSYRPCWAYLAHSCARTRLGPPPGPRSTNPRPSAGPPTTPGSPGGPGQSADRDYPPATGQPGRLPAHPGRPPSPGSLPSTSCRSPAPLARRAGQRTASWRMARVSSAVSTRDGRYSRPSLAALYRRWQPSLWPVFVDCPLSSPCSSRPVADGRFPGLLTPAGLYVVPRWLPRERQTPAGRPVTQRDGCSSWRGVERWRAGRALGRKILTIAVVPRADRCGARGHMATDRECVSVLAPLEPARSGLHFGDADEYA